MPEITTVQARLLFNIGDHEVTAGEFKSRGYYQGSNLSYNLKKLVEMGFIHDQRCEIDRRSLRVRLAEKGRNVREIVDELFSRHAEGLEGSLTIEAEPIHTINGALGCVERFWTGQIRYIYSRSGVKLTMNVCDCTVVGRKVSGVSIGSSDGASPRGCVANSRNSLRFIAAA